MRWISKAEYNATVKHLREQLQEVKAKLTTAREQLAGARGEHARLADAALELLDALDCSEGGDMPTIMHRVAKEVRGGREC